MLSTQFTLTLDETAIEPEFSDPIRTDLTGSSELNIDEQICSEAFDADVFSLDISDALTTDTLFDFGESDLEAFASTGAATYTVGISYYDPVDYGDPLTDSIYWREQAGTASCAVVAQISVYESLTGYRISEADACDYAEYQGWFDPNTGTQPADMGNILSALGVATYGGFDSTLNQLATALWNGDKPIVSLDANEIWSAQRDRYGNAIEQSDAGHAVWVTGIDIKPNNSINIILNDSGTPLGQSEVVSYTDFYNAWHDFGFQMVVADNPLT
jgi:hypothetical protein